MTTWLNLWASRSLVMIGLLLAGDRIATAQLTSSACDGAQCIPGLIDPFVYAINSTNEAYEVSWRVEQQGKSARGTKLAEGKATIAPRLSSLTSIGKFDWILQAGKQSINANKVIVRVMDKKGKEVAQQVLVEPLSTSPAGEAAESRTNILIVIKPNKIAISLLKL
jgi:hypothetical protein